MSRSGFVRQPLDTVIARYNRVAPLYRYLEWSILLAPGFRRRAVQRLELRPGQSVLEVGCGTGRNLQLLSAGAGSSGEVIGVDATPNMLAEAQKLIERRGLTNVHLMQADAAQLKLDEQVDVAYFSLSYSVMPDRDASLDRAWEALETRRSAGDHGCRHPRQPAGTRARARCRGRRHRLPGRSVLATLGGSTALEPDSQDRSVPVRPVFHL